MFSLNRILLRNSLRVHSKLTLFPKNNHLSFGNVSRTSLSPFTRSFSSIPAKEAIVTKPKTVIGDIGKLKKKYNRNILISLALLGLYATYIIYDSRRKTEIYERIFERSMLLTPEIRDNPFAIGIFKYYTEQQLLENKNIENADLKIRPNYFIRMNYFDEFAFFNFYSLLLRYCDIDDFFVRKIVDKPNSLQSETLDVIKQLVLLNQRDEPLTIAINIPETYRNNEIVNNSINDCRLLGVNVEYNYVDMSHFLDNIPEDAIAPSGSLSPNQVLKKYRPHLFAEKSISKEDKKVVKQ